MSLPRLFSQWAVVLAPLALVAAGASTAWAQAASAIIPASAVTPMPAPAVLPPVPAAHACGAGGCATGTCGATSCAVGCGECQKKNCPPKFVICTPKPPKLCFKCSCPKPVCDPCHLDPTGNYGYTPTCWRPWMAPPNYSHCPVPSTTQLMPPCTVDVVPVPVPLPLPLAPEKELPSSRLETRDVLPSLP